MPAAGQEVMIEVSNLKVPDAPRKTSYAQIVKSSALIGGSSAFNIVMGIVRTKAMALLLGPAGVGLLGVYYSIFDLAKTVAGMGISTSGVRQIAEAAATGDDLRISRTVTTLRRIAALLGLLGALLLVALCIPIARVSFGTAAQAGAVALLGAGVFCGALSLAQGALLQGMRRIGELAMLNAVGGFLGTAAAIATIWIWGPKAIVWSIVAVAAASWLVSWWYSRRIKVVSVPLSWPEVSAEVAELLKLGFVFMASGFLAMAAGYFTRVLVLRQLGEDAAGFYQSAWTLGGLYVGFLLQAMGADFFPRLTAVAKDNPECNRLVNEQAEVGLLIAGPGVLATLTFTPLVIQIFYSAKFGPAVEVLRWICLGMVLRVASWPMSYILLAKGLRKHYFWSEIAANVAQVGLVWVCIAQFGLNGTGIAFFLGYVFYWFLIFFISRSVSGFSWSRASQRVGLVYALAIGLVFCAYYFPSRSARLVAGGLITIFGSVYSLKQLCSLVPLERLPRPIQRLLTLARIAKTEHQ